MKIGLFYRDYLNPGGMPQETRYLAEALSRRGHEVIVFCYGDTPVCDGENGVTRKVFRHPRLVTSVDPDLRDLLRSNQDRLDVLFLIGGHIPENFGVSRAAFRAGIPYIISVGEAYNPYNLEKGSLKKGLWKRLFESRILQDSLAVRCYSRENVKQLEAYLQGLESFILREGVHTFEVSPPESGVYDSRDTNLLFLGRISIWKKGIDQLIDAVAQIHSNYARLRLHIVGPVENADRSWFRRLRRLLPDEVLRYHGAVYTAEKYAYLAGTDLFVHPSRHEGIPRSIREAMAVGSPLLVSRETNVAEDVERYEAGFVVAPESKSIAAAIEAFLDYPEKESLRRNVLRMARELYDWDVIARELEGWLGGRIGGGFPTAEPYRERQP